MRLLHLSCFIFYMVLCLILVYGTFLPSYSNPPQRYNDLRHRVQVLNQTANVNNEKVFIVASLYDKDGELVSGHWGRSVRGLIDILGHDNVFLSIYENDPNDQSKQALRTFEESLPCDNVIKYEHFDKSELPRAVMEDGTQRFRRMPFLAEVRNRALHPLEDKQSKAHSTRWDKLLYLNDVAFNPIDAANLLLSTNVDERTGKTNYNAACALDFTNPFKYYDTLATRDTDGNTLGVPFYPWFAHAGSGTSRREVLEQKDAVQVKSCWGGMVAFEAKWFQSWNQQSASESTESAQSGIAEAASNHSIGHTTHAGYQNPGGRDSADNLPANPVDPIPTLPLRFRAETDLYWDASECCLIHADLASSAAAPRAPGVLPASDTGTGIFMNPYVRVAYFESVLPWIPLAARFERLYPIPHHFVNIIGGKPDFNARQFEQPGTEVVDRLWTWDEQSLARINNGTGEEGLQGKFEDVRRVAKPGMFCGRPEASYLKVPGDEDRPGVNPVYGIVMAPSNTKR